MLTPRPRRYVPAAAMSQRIVATQHATQLYSALIKDWNSCHAEKSKRYDSQSLRWNGALHTGIAAPTFSPSPFCRVCARLGSRGLCVGNF